MKKIKQTMKCFYILLFFSPFFAQSQILVLRLVEAEFSATANVAAYIYANAAEQAISMPLATLRNESIQETLFFDITSVSFATFTVVFTLAALQAYWGVVQAANLTSVPFFNRRFFKYQIRLNHYQAYITELGVRLTAATGFPTNRGNSLKLSMSVLSEIHRVFYELGKMFDYLYVRNLISILPI
ncbi:hypothetical protein OAC51_03895 [Flavobacteriaceae bacterium]|nr:hypothetical protein [Flavobacteriaceae bacterium]